jgi:rhamnogalacturonan II specific xylosyltransferase
MASEAFPRFVFVMAFTGPHLPEARNELVSLQRARGELPPAEVHIYTRLPEGQGLDSQSAIQIFDLDIPGVAVNTAEADWGTSGFSRIVMGKFHALLRTLELAPDAHVVWLDTDLFFFKDPRPELLKHAAAFPKAIAHFQRSCGERNVCTGFFHMPPGYRDAQRKLLVQAMARLQRHNAGRASGYKGDEACINEELATGRYTFSFLLRNIFPNGQDFFKHKLHDRVRVVLVHNNFVKGLASKISRFKAHGFWIIDDM